MVLKRRKRIPAIPALLALLLPIGCAWVDEETGPVTVEPVRYGRESVMPEEQEFLRGFRLSATTSEIQAFLGRRDFRIAVSLHDGSPGIFVLEPGEPGVLPRIQRYSRGRETFSGRDFVPSARCALSPDGNALVYSLGGYLSAPVAMLWLLNLGPDRAWRIPVLSEANGGYGMSGTMPYWQATGDRRFIGFKGAALPDGTAGIDLWRGYADEAQRVEVKSDGEMSPAAPLEVNGSRIAAEVGGVSGDDRWVLVHESWGGSYLVPASHVPDLRYRLPGDLPPEFFVGRYAALNPFDSAATSHTDYHATFPYSIQDATGNAQDTLYDPRTLDGRRVTATHSLAQDDFWVCDGSRRILYTLKVGSLPTRLQKRAESPVEIDRHNTRAIWTTHPNFVLIHSSRVGAWIVKLAASEEALFGNHGTQTVQAAGALRLLRADPDQDIDFAFAFEDISMWIGGD